MKLQGIVLALSLTAGGIAQAHLETPSPSPWAKVEARIGVTDFSIEYSSPGVKGRAVFGEVVAWDKPWRAGANEPTKLTASRDFTFGTTTVKAGSYSLFVIPAKTGAWTVALNKDLEASQDKYDAKKNAATVKVAPATLAEKRERLGYFFTDAEEARANLDLEWDKVRIRVPLAVDTKGHVEASLKEELGQVWRQHFEAANYLLDKDPARARTLVEKSIAIEPTWRNEWLRARVLIKLDAKANKTEALASVARAEKLGKGDEVFEKFIKPQIATATASWK